MFHTLARDCADLLVGGKSAERSSPAWRQAYRALQHTRVADVCRTDSNQNSRKKRVFKKFPTEIQDFGNSFVDLQKKRHAADYDPLAKPLTYSEVKASISMARGAIKRYKSATKANRRAFAVFVTMDLRAD
ncbi:MAG: hypothetical protein AAFP17_10385 [Pseudomonadota bacterium]